MSPAKKKFTAKIPNLDLTEGADMLTDFSREAQRHLISARNSLLVLETVPSDKEAIENVFKTFHTIKGLADFLNLEDVASLTHEAEVMLDMNRKDQLTFEGEIVTLTTQAIDSLQKLLELLDEQIAGGGQLTSDYPNVGELIAAIQEATSNKLLPELSPNEDVPEKKQPLPTINYEPDMSICSKLEAQLKNAKDEIAVGAEELQNLVAEFQNTSKELKDAQSKLQERQRELIKERELAIKLTEQAQSEARAKSEYLANMSHEIRTLINAILGFTDLLKEGLSEKQKEHLNTIILSGKMLLGIVNDILDYSKVESGKLKLEKIDFNLDHIVEEVFRIIRSRLNGKQINLFIDIDDDVPQNLIGDPTRLKQIFINLLENAIKFTEGGEIGIAVKTEQELLDGQQMIRFCISDSGIGIPEDRRKLIFESFAQAHDSTTRLYGGTGLGLALCKTFVENMGGKIWVESDLGKGSQFIFTIKLRESGITPSYVFQPDLSNFSGSEIMVVDSHQTSNKTISKFLKHHSLKLIDVATSAKQASEILIQRISKKKSLPAIIFIDVMLPDKEGYMLAYKLKQQDQFANIKIVAVSADVKVDLLDDFKRAKFDLFLAKPYLKPELNDAIVRLLGDGPMERKAMSHEMLKNISCEGVRVLVVEDSVPNQELLKVHFDSLGCVCDYANNGKEAIENFEKNEYDVCFMDLQMPIMGGIEATKIIRTELKSSVPIVALTAAEAEEEREKCFEVGMSDYLPKPFELDELKEKIIRCAKM